MNKYKELARLGVIKTMSDKAVLSAIHLSGLPLSKQTEEIYENCCLNAFLFAKAGKKRWFGKRKEIISVDPKKLKRTISKLLKKMN